MTMPESPFTLLGLDPKNLPPLTDDELGDLRDAVAPPAEDESGPHDPIADIYRDGEWVLTEGL